ncbi:tumor necrosis factor receptor superfamily member 1B-like [Ambystoma mexicanum]|uniref:tumor necrosis factor receptor superfamily member 1B-like n=1 Tax=Ambystoma mexicanum TaxID=8296 RepID=UPI0037E81296
MGQDGQKMLPTSFLLFFVLHSVVETQERNSNNKEYLLPYPPSPENACKDPKLEYYHKKAQMCCSKCPPGHHLSRECNSTSDTDCKPCGLGAYTEVWNHMKQCHHCEPFCREDAGLMETQSCNATHKRVCSCISTKYCALESPPSCQVCADLTICQKGFGASIAGTENSNTECSPCPSNTFSDEESHSAPCKPHRNCSSVSVPGDSTRDVICADSEVDPPYATRSETGMSSEEDGDPDSEPDYHLTRAGSLTPVPAKVAAKSIGVPLGVISGGILFAMVGLAGIAYFIGSEKTRHFCTHLRTETVNINTAGEKNIDQRQQQDHFLLSYGDPALEQEHLLEDQRSSSCSLETLPSSAVLGGNIPNDRETLEGQKGSLTSKGAKGQEGLQQNSVSSDPSWNVSPQVNVTCIVNVCNPDHGPWITGPPAEEWRVCPSIDEHTPLSKEEHSSYQESETPISIEFGGTSILSKGAMFPLSVEDTEMKMS